MTWIYTTVGKSACSSLSQSHQAGRWMYHKSAVHRQCDARHMATFLTAQHSYALLGLH